MFRACQKETTQKSVLEYRQNAIFSCNRGANLALCRTVLRRGRARWRDRTGCGNTSESSDTNELTLGEYFYESDKHTKGLSRRGLRHRIRGVHGPQAHPGADR